MNDWKCSKLYCNQPVHTDPDFSKPAQRYDRACGNNLCYVIAHPHKELERPAYCYYHKAFHYLERRSHG